MNHDTTYSRAEIPGNRWTYFALAEWSFTKLLDCKNETNMNTTNTKLWVANCTWATDEAVNRTSTASWILPTPDATVFPIQPSNVSIHVAEESLNSSCVRRSFTYPGWWVDVPTAQSIRIRNMATNYTATWCATPPNNDKGSICDRGAWETLGLSGPPETQLRRSSTPEMVINQTWKCAGVKSEFSSSASFTIPKNLSSYQSFEVQGTLSKPVELRPNRPPPPKGIKTPGCTAASANPRWTISNIRQWQERFVAISAFVSFFRRNGTLDFDLYNHANQLTTHCRVEGEELTNYTGFPLTVDTIRYDKWFDCDVNTSDPHQFPKYNVSTLVQFDKRSGFLRLNHTWFCSDEGDDQP